MDSMLAAAVKNTGEVRYCAAPVYADAPVEKKLMYHPGHTKIEDLTDTFEHLAKGGKRFNVTVWADQSENPQIFPKTAFTGKKKRTKNTCKAESPELPEQRSGLQHASPHVQRPPRNEHGPKMEDRHLEKLCRRIWLEHPSRMHFQDVQE